MSAELSRRIARRIAAEGPLPVAAFMAMALHDPQHGYYASRLPIGAAGDFITAPEVSQIFGELIGLWCARMWEMIGRPNPVILAELGPGRGVLAADLMRAAGAVPEFRQALRLHLVEASPLLRAEQKRRLADAEPVWLDDAGELPAGPMLLVANEFLDALPIRQFVRGAAGWAERMVALDPGGALVFADAPTDPAGALMAAQAGRDAGPGDVVEICPAALSLAALIGSRMAREPGAALFIDYARANRRSGSLCAVRGHRPTPVLSEPGSADLSAEVDFAAFAETASAAGAMVWGPTPQARFLAGLGARLRLARLAEHALPGQRRPLEEGLERLLDPAGMGGFQVLAIVPPGLVGPPP